MSSDLPDSQKVLHALTGVKDFLCPNDNNPDSKSLDLYTRLNKARDWFNTFYAGEFQIYLEDEWDVYIEGQTWFDYNLRSLKSKDELPPLASDVYLNHQDNNGVWNLGDYQSSHVRDDLDWNHIEYFLTHHRCP